MAANVTCRRPALEQVRAPVGAMAKAFAPVQSQHAGAAIF
jgi:hypothetical protein